MDPSKEMFDQLKNAVKNVMDTLSEWQKKESSLHSLAEQHAMGDNPHLEDGQEKDAKIYSKKQMIKKAMADSMNNAQPPMPPPDMGGGMPMGMPPPPMGGMPPGMPPMGG